MSRRHPTFARRAGLVLMICVLASTVLAADAELQIRRPPVAAPSPATVCSDQQVDALGNKLATLQESGKTLRELGAMSVPKGLDYEETKRAYGYAAWLRKTSDDLDSLSAQGRRLIRACRRVQRADGVPLPTEQLQEMQQTFNQQYLALQNRIAHENREFSMVSNIMKNRHDTAKNAINNIR